MQKTWVSVSATLVFLLGVIGALCIATGHARIFLAGIYAFAALAVVWRARRNVTSPYDKEDSRPSWWDSPFGGVVQLVLVTLSVVFGLFLLAQ